MGKQLKGDLSMTIPLKGVVDSAYSILPGAQMFVKGKSIS